MDPGLPTGTVTLLFSDIEGSTSLLRRLGEGYADALSAQRSLCAARSRGGTGARWAPRATASSSCSRPSGDAVDAALQAQRDLAGHAWPGGERVRVRMGLHTGEPVRHEDGYIGIDVHLAARVASVAAGGQVVLTAATQQIWRARPVPDVAMLDLGRHRLKDIPEPVRLYQLAADGLDRDFPPLRSLGGLTRLPATAATTVGRDGEIDELRQLLADGGTQLVTLTGPGGSGKTRLALATAESLVGSFPDGVYFVPLESVTSADVMWTQVADRVGLTGDDRSPAALVAQLTTQRALLVLDNLEQLPAAAEVVHELLDGARPHGPRHLAAPASPLRRVRAPGAAADPARRPTPAVPGSWAGPARCSCSCSGPSWSGPASASTRTTPTTSPRSAGSSTGCRWRSSWPPPASSCSAPARCAPGSPVTSSSWPDGRRSGRRGSRRCGTR